jgi:thiamine-phosphate pyrophosphorylase
MAAAIGKTMHKGQPLPTLWMMSDERMGDGFLTALARMPKGSGLIFRHYATPAAERRALFDAARRIARARRLVVMLAGSIQHATAWRADGVHGRHKHPAPRFLLHTMPVHNRREMRVAETRGVDLLFISPVFPTRSHPGARTLGRRGLKQLAQHAKSPVIALGGMTAHHFKSLKSNNIIGWAAIDGLTTGISC